MTNPLSLVLVTVDCLRADHVGFLGYSRPTTPFLDSLASQSFVVPNTFVGGVPTYYSFPAILASRHPLARGRDLIGLAPGEASLPVYLKQNGYSTAAFLAANPYLSARFGYDQGFDSFHDFLGPVISPSTSSTQLGTLRHKLNRILATASHRFARVGKLYDDLYFEYCQRMTPAATLDALRPYPAADVLVDRAIEWLAATASPFFLWLHFMDPHAPYYPSEEAQRAMGLTPATPVRARYINSYWNRSDLEPNQLGRQRDAVLEFYDAGIRWVDMHMSRLVKTLMDLQLWDRCVLAFTADHGEEFLEHGSRFHAPWQMKEELVRVPLLARVPGLRGQRVRNKPFSHVHLAPTLLDAMDLPVPNEFSGRSYLKRWLGHGDWDEPVVIESAECANPHWRESRLASRVLCVRDTDFKLILRCGSGEEQLFDLQDDAGESRPLAADVEQVVRRRLLACAATHIQRTSMFEPSDLRLRAHLRDIRLDLKKPAVQPASMPAGRANRILSNSSRLLALAMGIGQLVDIYSMYSLLQS